MSNEKGFLGQFKGVLAVIASIVIIILLVAPELIGAGGEKAVALEEAQVHENVMPMGQVATSKEAAAKATPEQVEVAAVATGPLTGKQVFDQACFACHATGVSGAPKSGDTADWAPRLAQGNKVLLEHALNGFNLMPAKGGFTNLSDQNIQDGIDYMTGK